ncbi:hypothetical protein ACQ4LE_010356 [Meloidogyne hapla]
MQTKNPAQMKRIGSRIKGFDHQKWRQICILVMVIANLEKYKQNAELRRMLVSTSGSLLVESTSKDLFWGAGAGINSPAIRDMANWKGKNVLGLILTDIRMRMLNLEMSKTPIPSNINTSYDIEYPPLQGTSSRKVATSASNASKSAKSTIDKSPPQQSCSSSSVKNVEQLVESTSKMHIQASAIKRIEIVESEKAEKSTDEKLGQVEEEKEKKVVEYLVCQVEEHSVIGARFNPTTNKSWPHFIQIKNELAENSEGFVEKLQLGDSVWVSCFEWREGYRALARNEGEVTRYRKIWFHGRINSQAVVTSIELIVYAPRVECSGVVIRIRETKGVRSCCIVIASHLQVSTRCYRRQLIGLNLDEIEIGQLVTLSVAKLPANSLVDDSYILPHMTEFKIGAEEVIQSGMGTLGTVEPHGPWPYKRNGKNVFYPLLPEMTPEEVELSESIMSAAIGYSYEDERKTIIENRFEGVAIYLDELFHLCFCQIDNAKVKTLKDAWSEEDQVVLKSEMHLPHFANGVVRKIEVSQVQSFGTKRFDFWIRVKVINVQERKDRDVEEELSNAQDGGFVVVHPMLFKGLESRRDCFATHLPSMLSTKDTNQGRLLRALMAREFEVDDDPEEWDASAVERIHPLMRMLNRKQQETAKILLEEGCRFVFQQAPPGVGKTYVASIVVAIMLSIMNNVKVAVVTAANLPLAKLARELEEVLGSPVMEDSGAVAFFSGYAKDKYFGMINELRQHMLVTVTYSRNRIIVDY